MQNNPLVTVVIPVYNVENFLKETVESVLNQTLADFEIIIVNDGSTDGSAKICEDFQAQDARIKYFSQENSGVSVARNLGLKHAKGDYIFFLDSDDTIDEDFLKSSYENALQYNSDIVILGDYYIRRLPNVMALPTCAQFLKLRFLKKYPEIRFPEKIQPGEDGLLSHQLLALTDKVSLNKNAVYHYRQHENQNHVKINENAGKVLEAIPQWFDILEKFYTKHQLFESHALHLALFVEHEPFEFRYLAMPLTMEQKVFLQKIIKEFMAKNVFPYLTKKDEKYLNKPFRKFLMMESAAEFLVFNIAYAKNKKKLSFKLNQFIAKVLRKRIKRY